MIAFLLLAIAVIFMVMVVIGTAANSPEVAFMVCFLVALWYTHHQKEIKKQEDLQAARLRQIEVQQARRANQSFDYERKVGPLVYRRTVRGNTMWSITTFNQETIAETKKEQS